MAACAVWLRLMKHTISAAHLAPNSLSPGSMDVEELREYALRPYRFEKLLNIPYVSHTREAGVGCKFMFDGLSGDVPDHSCIHLLPGGRWVIGSVTMGDENGLLCWDLRIVIDGFEWQIKPMATLTAVHPVEEDPEDSKHPLLFFQSDALGEGVNILHSRDGPSYVFVFFMHNQSIAVKGDSLTGLKILKLFSYTQLMRRR